MRLERVVLREVTLRLRKPLETSFGTIADKRFLVVEVDCGGVIGYGEVGVLSAPSYAEETAATAWHVLADFLVPLAFRTRWDHPETLAAALRAVRGHRAAKAGLEGAVWDAFARSRGLSLAQALGGEQADLPAGAVLGLERDLESLCRRAEACVARGYRRLKLKIAPGWDFVPLAALRERLGRFPLMADANAAYTLADLPALQRLDALGLTMIEQPLAEDDIVDHARLQSALNTPVCLDESLRSAEDVRKAVELGSCRIVNVKLSRVGGHAECLRLHAWCRSRRVPLWCGGMFESGIGRAHNLALASLPGFTLPGDFAPPSDYLDTDLIAPPLTLSAAGTISVPSGPGLGVAV
ncbi:MAG TPA: o-succinylbenzoate synthase, partial [Limnochordia bacterium]